MGEVLGVRLIYVCAESSGKGRVCDLMEGQDPLKGPSWESEPSSILGWTDLNSSQRSFFMLLIPMSICLAFTVASLTAASSFPMNALHVQINGHRRFNISKFDDSLSHLLLPQQALTRTHTRTHTPLWSPWFVHLHFVATTNSIIFILAQVRCIS